MKRIASFIADFILGKERCRHGMRLRNHGVILMNCEGCAQDMDTEYQALKEALEQENRAQRIEETMEALRRFHRDGGNNVSI